MGNINTSCKAEEQKHEVEAMDYLGQAFNEHTVAVISELAAVLERANTKTFKTAFKYPSIVNLGMISLQCKRENRNSRPAQAGSMVSDRILLTKATRYARYAQAAYCSDADAIARVLQGGDDSEDFSGNVEVLYVQMPQTESSVAIKRASAELGYFVAKDKASGDIVLSIRGKATAHEAIRAVVSESKPCMNGHIPEMLLNDANKLMDSATVPIEVALNNSPGSQLVVVGHGCGGGLASLITLLGFGEGTAARVLLAQHKVKCFAFGPPPLYEALDDIPLDRSWAIHSFVYGMDVVPRLSPAAVGKLLMAMRKVDSLDMEMPARMKAMRGESPYRHVSMPDWEEIPDAYLGQFENLELVGNVIVLTKMLHGPTVCEHLLGQHVERIPLHEDMALDHTMDIYEDSLAEVVMGLHKNKGCC